MKRLIEQKKITKQGDKYFVSMNTPVQMSLSDKKLVAIYRELVNSYDDNTYGDILFQITKKIYDAIDLKLCGEEIQKVDSIILQNEKSHYERYENILKSLFSADYKSKRIKVKGHNRHKEEIEDIVFSVGSIIFLAEEGSFYLLGKSDKDYQAEGHEAEKLDVQYTLIKLSRVQKIEETNQKNYEYGKKEYEEICEEMYKISAEESFNVTLEYKNTPRNLKKITEYEQNRKFFVRQETKEDVIVCSDRVRGQHDYERFLRREGNEVIVTSPSFIVSDMVKSAERIIERYKDEQ